MFLLFMEKDNNIGMCISAVFVWLIKEDASVLMMFVGVVLMVEGLSDLISIIRISSFIKNLRG